MHKRKLSVRQAYFLGQLIVNGGVILVILGVWILSFVVVAKFHLSVWLVLAGIFAGPLVAWIWWAFSTPRWRDFASQYMNDEEIQQLHQAAIQGQLEWPQGHIFSRTEIKSRKQKLKELETALSSIEELLRDDLHPRRLDTFRAKGLDIRVVEDINVFLKNLRYRVDTSGRPVDFHADAQSIDDFIERLKRSNRELEKLHLNHDEALDWYGPVSRLTQELALLKKLLCAIS